MEQVFANTPEGFSYFRKYMAFKEHMLNIGCFLPLSTVINFTALSKHFQNILNNPKSDYGRMFWKIWSIKTGNMKGFKGKTINYKFKLVKKKIDLMKKKIKSYSVPYWRTSRCKNCNKECLPDRWMPHYFHDQYNRYCNCQIVDCETKIENLQKELSIQKRRLINKQIILRDELIHIDDKITYLEKKENDLKKLTPWRHFIGVIENMKEKAHYKGTRTQAGKELRILNILISNHSNERLNANYKAPE